MYKVKTTKLFDKRLANLGYYFDLTDDQVKEAIESIKYSMTALKDMGKLPEEYQDHKLEDEPWIGFNEYHILDDLLVVYYRVDSKKNLRFTTITNHKELRKGTLTE